MKRTEKDLYISPFRLNFAAKCKKNSSQMLQLSEKMPIFVPSVEKDWRHRGERLSFDPLENLQNSTCTGKSLKAASPAVAYILLTPLWSRFAYIPAGVS